MARLGEMFPSKYLKADDLPDEGIIVTIRSIDEEKMTDGQMKHVLYFDEVEKGLVLNKTNATIISKLYEDDTDGWEDERVTLYPTYIDFKGEQVNSIRVKPKKPVPAIKKAKAAATTDGKLPKAGKANPMTQEEADEDDGEAPF